MTSEFLRSSPARSEEEYKFVKFTSTAQTPASSKLSAIAFAKSITSSATKSHKSAPPLPPPPTFPPSASKLSNNPANFTGWTPLISKTYSNDQILSLNSTPNRMFAPASAANLQQHQQPAPPTQDRTGTSNQPLFTAPQDYDLQGFGLTPFINHNFNIMGSTYTTQFYGITPYQERIFQQNCDFFIDSPIRTNNNNNKNNPENFAITPSKFNLNTIASSKKLLQDPLKSATKRSITLIDTPPRQPHKLSLITTKARSDTDEEDEEEEEEEEVERKEIQEEEQREKQGEQDEVRKEDEEKRRARNSPFVEASFEERKAEEETDEEANDDVDDEDKDDIDEEDEPVVSFKTEIPSHIQQTTPCKKKPLKDVSNRLRQEFNTPGKKMIPLSSPSTIILTSSKDDAEARTKNKIKESADDKENNMPPSPTPAKIPTRPIMGIFSEKKTTAKPKAKPRPKSASSMSSSKSTSSSTNKPRGTASQAENKTKMQAGMTKFQIVISDMNTFAGKKKTRKQQHKGDSSKSAPAIKPPTIQPPMQSQSQPQPQPPMSSLMDHNMTINTTREQSTMLSLGNNSINTSSQVNITTDQTSFEMSGMGGMSSTPNSKVFLDRIFEKTSPQQMAYFPQHMQQHHPVAAYNPHSVMPQPHPQQPQPQSQQEPMQPPPPPMASTNMPPPPQPPLGVVKQFQPLQQQANFPIMGMMSTPEHSHIYNANTGNEMFSTQVPSPWNYGFGTPQGYLGFNNNNNSNNQTNNNSNFQFTTNVSGIPPSNGKAATNVDIVKDIK
ncbi:uncharacterized protein LODBEIA_P24990 [Lodderomyces beijingensis]|uniref:Altered inheritance of mitochondria protein 21 n=1 Tax=Lodderomyces beijingensis TaxID=1775926 RepID=A0ABP0ZJG5_9ASCO